jgi:hypothetical protein
MNEFIGQTERKPERKTGDRKLWGDDIPYTPKKTEITKFSVFTKNPCSRIFRDHEFLSARSSRPGYRGELLQRSVITAGLWR